MADCDLYWTAGFLEGEGSFILNRRAGHTSYPVVKANQTETECLDRLQLLYGGSLNLDRRLRDGPGSKRRPLFEWRVTGRRAFDLMCALEPLMSEKRQAQIRAVLEEVERLGLKMHEKPGRRLANGNHRFSASPG